MIISSATDYREAARRKLPRFLFDYLDGGANAESTMRANVDDLAALRLRQRVLQGVAQVDLSTELFGEQYALPVILSPIGIMGMYARRGEVQAACAGAAKKIPFVASTVGICSLEEICKKSPQPIWFQLYILRDRGFMRHVLERARASGITTLVFTVDMPLPGSRYRDAHSGMSGPYAAQRRIMQALTKPSWSWDVGIRGRPHDLGNISRYLGKAMGLADYAGWLKKNFDPSIAWSDLQWIRDAWPGVLILKGILDADDAREAVRIGADGIVVSNHGGRQLDGALSTAKVLPAIAQAVGGDVTVLADSGIRSGIDVLRMMALGARGVMIGRAAMYGLAARGQAGVEHVIDIFAQEMRIAMTLTGVRSLAELGADILA